MALLTLPPPFDPNSMILEVFSSEQVQNEKIRYLLYLTPAAQEQRAAERAQQQQEILAQQSGIIDSLQKQCLSDQAFITENPDVIFISPFIGVDCAVGSGVLAAVPASGAIYNDLTNQYNALNTDPPFETILKVNPEKLDQDLIGKYAVLLETWCLHLEINGQLFGPGIPPIIPCSEAFQPLFLSPSLIRDTCSTMYFTQIKPYNVAHSDYINAQKSGYIDYISDASKQQRLRNRIANSGNLQNQLNQVNAAIAVEQGKLAALTASSAIGPADDLLVITTSEPQTITDAVQFNQNSLDRIAGDIANIRSDSDPVGTIAYLSGDITGLLATVTRVDDLLLATTNLIKNLTSAINATQQSIFSIDTTIQSEDRALVAVLLDVTKKTSAETIVGITNLIVIIDAFFNIKNSQVNFSTINSFVQYTDLLESPGDFAARIRQLIPTLDTNLQFSEKIRLLISAIQTQYEIDVTTFNANNPVATTNKPFLDLLFAIMNAMIAQFKPPVIITTTTTTQNSNTTQPVDQFKIQRLATQASEANAELLNTVYDLSPVVINLITLKSDYQTFVATLQTFNVLVDSPDPIIQAFGDLKTRYANLDAQTKTITQSEHDAIPQIADQVNTIDPLIVTLQQQFAQQQQERSNLRTTAAATLNARLIDLQNQLTQAQTLTKDTDKIHSYRVLKAFAILLGQERDAITAAIKTEKDRIDALKASLSDKQQQLSSLQGNVVFLSQIALLNAQIGDIQSQINAANIPDASDLVLNINDLIQELLFSISQTILNLTALAKDLQDQIDHPEVDPPFQFKDPFDEVFNSAHAITFFFMLHLVKYLTSIFFTSEGLPPPETGVLSVLTFNPAAISESNVTSTATKIANDIKSSPPAKDFVSACLNFVLKGLIKRLSEHIIAYGQFVGTNTIFLSIPPFAISTESAYQII